MPGTRHLRAASLRFLVALIIAFTFLPPPHTAQAQAFSGNWFETNALQRTMASVIYDPVRHRLLLFGGSGGDLRNDVWSFDLSGTSGWVQVATLGTPPPPVSDAAAVYDPVGDRMIICSGLTAGSPGGGCYDGFNRTAYALTLSGQPEWKTLATGGYGAAGVSAVYDSRRNRVIVFGGLTFGCLCGSSNNDAYALDLGSTPTWSHLLPTFPIGMPPPSSRSEHVAVYDSLGDRMIVFGGDSGTKCSTNFLSDVWSLSMDSTLAWTKLNPGSGPTARARMVGVLDSARNRMVVFGGAGSSDAWALDLAGGTSWSPVSTSGSVPSNTSQGSAAYDVADDRLVYENDGQTSALAFSTQAWTTLDQTAALPEPRDKFVSMVDPVRRRFVVFGGHDDHNTLRNDVWSLSLDSPWQWQQLHPAGTPPSARYNALGVYDPQGDEMVIFGGNGSLQDSWALHFSPTLSWEQLQPTGTLPYARTEASAVYDPVHQAMVVYGGFDGYVTVLDDVRSLSLAGAPTWTQLTPQGTSPGPREGQVAIYDPVAARMIVFGGSTSTGRMNDVWALSLDDSPTWSPISPSGSQPTPRYNASGFYDAASGRLIIRSGETSYQQPPIQDMWALTLGGASHWNQMVPQGTGPAYRLFDGEGFDSLTANGVYFGGASETSSNQRNDAWLLDLNDVPVPILLTLRSSSVTDGVVRLQWFGPEPGMAASVFRRTATTDWQERAHTYVGGDGILPYDDKDVVAGGRYGYRVGYTSSGNQTFTAETWVDVTLPHELAFASLAPNPMSSRFGVSFSLPTAADARLEIVDLRGRVVFREDLTGLGAGNHQLALQPSLASGLYVVRLSQGVESISHKLVVVGR
jgi:hypothetical protein